MAAVEHWPCQSGPGALKLLNLPAMELSSSGEPSPAGSPGLIDSPCTGQPTGLISGMGASLLSTGPAPAPTNQGETSTPDLQLPRLAAHSPDRLAVWVMGAGLVGLFLKLLIAFNTFGTNDAITFYRFARSLSEHGLEWTYRHGVPGLSSSSVFNHPPLTSYLLRGLYHLAQIGWLESNGLTFPFLLRLPGIIADFVVVLLLFRLWQANQRLHRHAWAFVLFALSPVSIMVSGFHGNTDPLMVMFLVGAAYMAVREQPVFCGLLFGMSCQIKIIPLMILPIFFFFWWHRRAIVSFVLPTMIVFLCLWAEPLLKFPTLFIRNVISYGSYWGIWGITYWLRMTGFKAFSFVWYEGFSPAQNVVVTLLKALVVVSTFVIAWRRRKLDGIGLIESIALSWIVFAVFSPGVCAQYLVWPAPFILFLSPKFYGWITATCSLFLFFFYNIISHGLPWYLGISTNQLNTVWTPWSVWPWAAFIFGLGMVWKHAIAPDAELRRAD